ncbi:MDR family MFS transporter [Acidobacteriota bacterium]
MKMLKIIARTYKDAYSGLPREAWLLSLVELVNRSGTMVFFFMTLYLTKEFGYSTFKAGQVMSAYGFGALLGTYLGGKLTDSLGAYTVQKISLILTGVTFIVLGQATSFILILILMFALALFSETLHPSNATALSQVCPQELRTRGFALNRLAINIGVTIGPLVGGFLALIDYSYLFWVDGLTCLMAGILFIVMFKTNRPPRPEAAPQEELSGLEEPSLPAKKSSPWKDVYFLKIVGLVFLSGLVFIQLFSTFPLYLRESYGFQENSIGGLLAVNTVIIIVFEMILLNALKKRAPIQLVAIGSLFLGGGFALLPLGRGFLYAAFTVAVWTIGEMLVFPSLTTLIANHSDDASRGSYMGLFSLAFALAFTVGPSMGTFVYERLGPDIPWLICGLFGILIWLGFSSKSFWPHLFSKR